MHSGTTMPLTAFPALANAQIRTSTATPLHFELRREAGTITFDGTFRNGDGAGQFTFAPNAAYLATVRSLGITESRRNHDDEAEEDALFA
jgi:hypothetical protein